MINLVVCDDNENHKMNIISLIKNFEKNSDYDFEIKTYSSGQSLIFDSEDWTVTPDIIFLDIMMEGIDGIETAQRLRKEGIESIIIFLTDSSDFVFDAFNVRSFNYLLKQSLEQEIFDKVFLDSLLYLDKNELHYFIRQFNSEKVMVQLKDIEYFIADSRKIIMFYNEYEEFEFYDTMINIEKELEDFPFLRIHRSTLVNMKYISHIKDNSIILKSGVDLPVGRTYIQSSIDAYNKYIKESWR